MKKRIIALVLMMVLSFSSIPVFAEESVDVDLINEMINYIESYYNYDVDREDLITGAYRGIMDVLDKHSAFFTEREFNDFIDSLDGEFIGIGVYVEAYENYIKVVAPIDGMPAHKAGIKTNDIITHVDGKDVTQYTFQEAIDMILGVEGTEVQITVSRDGQTLKFNIIRELIIIPDVEYEMLDNKVGYLKIRQFGSSVAEEVESAILDLQNQQMSSIIIDLRGNPGGYLDQVITVADWFVEKDDPIVHIDSKAFLSEDYYASKAALNIPTMVLINEGTASASEILSGAIQNNDEGEIIGTTSYGKGTVQRLFPLSTGDAIKLTTAEYLTAGKVKINGIGVTPDYIIETKNQETDTTFVEMNSPELKYFGTEGADVLGAQQRLQYLGFDVDITGYFDSKTFKALKTFQDQNNLESKFAIYPETKEALNEAVGLLNNEDPQLDKALQLIEQLTQ